ncbi:nucleotidyltransferase [Blastococcus sp. KM273128]|uniref:nucleotidyltransferase n=1 Tax=Blastococcus sp. KM273128 TaxID=2570314 RepID=UPI001F3847DB|nr:nucleotidyltransferase [Blastococcus sp. KM273128]MCF6743548.1 nucleotidyltransferase [Blastococcus sp. KM273128]
MSVELSGYFKAFDEEISIGEPQTSRMESASNAIIDFLSDRYDLPKRNFFLQGSYPNGTAVEPLEGGEYDVDLVAVCVESSKSANQALTDMETVFRNDGRYSHRVVPKKPCIRLEYAPDDVGKFHVDVVPVRVTGQPSPPLDAPRRDEGWHGTAPAEYTAWCRDQGPLYAKTVKALKRWRDDQQTVRTAIKSIVLQVLVANSMPMILDDAARLANTIANLRNYLATLSTPPQVTNPVLPSENLAQRWTQESFDNFKRELNEAHDWVVQAQATDDLVEAVEAWREVLGDDFPAPSPAALGLRLADTSHEQAFAAQGWTLGLDNRYSVRIAAAQQRGQREKTRRPYTHDGAPIFAGNKIRFKATYQSPGHSEIWWQVTNTGRHAASRTDQMRGGFLKAQSVTGGTSRDQSVHWENTSYTGTHRVRAVLVRDATVVAISPWLNVNIWSKDWRHGI